MMDHLDMFPLHDFNAFRKHHDNLAMLSQAEYIKVETSRSFLPPTTPAHKLTLAEMHTKSSKRDDSLFSNFKDGKFWDN